MVGAAGGWKHVVMVNMMMFMWTFSVCRYEADCWKAETDFSEVNL